MEQVQKVQVQQAVAVALTAASLKAFYFGEQAERDRATLGKVEAGRLAHLFGMFERADLTAAKDAFSGMVATIKAEHGAKSAQYRAASVRASEARVLFGAYKCAGWKPEGLGYHDAVPAAREVLEEAGLKWDGTVILTDEESREKAAKAKQKRLIAKAVEIAEDEHGMATAENLPQAMSKAKEAVALEIAFGIIEKHGATLAELVAAQMQHALPNYDGWKAAKDAKRTK